MYPSVKVWGRLSLIVKPLLICWWRWRRHRSLLVRCDWWWATRTASFHVWSAVDVFNPRWRRGRRWLLLLRHDIYFPFGGGGGDLISLPRDGGGPEAPYSSFLGLGCGLLSFTFLYFPVFGGGGGGDIGRAPPPSLGFPLVPLPPGLHGGDTPLPGGGGGCGNLVPIVVSCRL